jgi:hypothetical protein
LLKVRQAGDRRGFVGIAVTSANIALKSVDWDLIRSLPDPEAAASLNGLLRSLDALSKTSYIIRGLILFHVEQRRLWAYLSDPTGQPFTSMEAWMCSSTEYSRRDCFYAKEAAKQLMPDIPIEDLQQISRVNVEVLRTLSKLVRRNPEIISAAQALPEREFRAKLMQDHPEQHVSATRKLVLTFSDGDYERVCSVLDSIGALIDVHDREGELLALCLDWEQEQVTQ